MNKNNLTSGPVMKNCPCCDSDNVEGFEEDHTERKTGFTMFQRRCLDCGIQTAWHHDRWQSLTAWNRRDFTNE